MLKDILSISGKPGLYKIIRNSGNTIIVESLVDGKKIPTHSNDRIIALEDISIYTENEDMPLKDVFKKIMKIENSGPAINHKESKDNLIAYMEKILPEYAKDKVYPSDMKKLFQWYNILQANNFLTQEAETQKAETEEV